MTSLWVILMDTSGSMGEPFSASAATSSFKGLLEEGTYKTKLDGAKEVLLKQLSGLSNTDIAVVAFSDDAHLVWSGTADDIKTVDESIVSMTPNGQTNLASAIMLALNDLAGSSSYRIISMLVISDGLSNVGDPVGAANACIQSGLPIRISAILIDPTPEGEDIARAVSIGGEVRGVASSIALDDAVRADYRSVEAASRAPAMSVRHQKEALRLHILIIVIFGILAFAGVVGGIYAIAVNAQSMTEFHFLGARFTTGHVGVACMGIGFIIGFFTTRAVLKSQLQLAALPPDSDESKRKHRPAAKKRQKKSGLK